jgi:signal peptidase I
MRKILPTLIIMTIWVAFCVGVAVLVNNFVLVNAQVLSGSMEGTIMTRDRVFGLRTGFSAGPPARGDIIVFASPIPCEFAEMFIKRIIALGGEQIKVCGGITHINGEPLIESYLNQSHPNRPIQRDFAPITVPYGHVFVMGDNRNNSRDSRDFGTIRVNDIIGRIYIILDTRH